MDIHAPFTRAERMQQLADIDHVSNKLPGRPGPSQRPATCQTAHVLTMCASHRTSPPFWT